MTPCEKLGYKVGDKFEVVGDHHAFEKGTVITLKRDDRTSNPLFTGARDDGKTEGFCSLHKIKPVSQRATKPISKSKRQLAHLLIEAGVTQFPDGANWAAQDKRNPHKDDAAGITLYTITPEKPLKGGHYWGGNTTSSEIVMFVETNTLIPNWHQTVLSRDEFDQIVAETAVESEPQPVPTAIPTLDQLLQDWCNADDYAQRKQTEADEAAAMRDERWQAVQARASEMGVTVGRCEPVMTESELVITNVRDVRCGDYVWVGDSGRSHNCPSGEYEVVEIDVRDTTQPFGVKWNDRVTWPQIHERGWRFVRRP